MGTRADFYIGRGKSAEWLGSIAMDGYPDGQPGDPEHGPVIGQLSEDGFRKAVAAMIAHCGHGTTPERGWPWPWNDSGTTDYAYAFDGGKVWASCFGHDWFDPSQPQTEREGGKSAEFPDMTARKNVTLGPRSGLIVLGG